MGSESNLTSEHDVNAHQNQDGVEPSEGDREGHATPDHFEQPYYDTEDLLKGEGCGHEEACPDTSFPLPSLSAANAPRASIEEVWDGLRAKSVKKLQTITTHSEMLKKVWSI